MASQSGPKLLSPFWMGLAAFGLIAPLIMIAIFGAPSGPGVFFKPWLIWCAGIFNASCGVCLLVMSSRRNSQPSA